MDERNESIINEIFGFRKTWIRLRLRVKMNPFKYLIKQQRAFEIDCRKAFRDASVRNIHQLRVTTRRIQSVIWLSRNSSPDISTKTLRKSIKQLSQTLGKRRQLDVAIRDSHKYNLKNKKLILQRQSTEPDIHKATNLKHQKQLTRQIENLANKIKPMQNFNISKANAKLERKLTKLAQKASPDNKSLHELRIATKKARYILEAIGKRPLQIRRLQAYLGRGHDLQVLQELTRKNARIQADANSEFKRAGQILKPSLKIAMKYLTGAI